MRWVGSSADGTAGWPHVGDAGASSASASPTRNAARPGETQRVPGRIITVGPLSGVVGSSSYASAHSGAWRLCQRLGLHVHRTLVLPREDRPRPTEFRWPP